MLLEWHGDGPPPKPLVKDVYGSDRRRAKMLNFSLVYGKTVAGLSKDWGVSVRQAQELLDKWYAARPEVKAWQEETIRIAHAKQYSQTLMGRRRNLYQINSESAAVQKHMERAAINTPVQGGAADVVMLAMIKLNSSETLKRLGVRWEGGGAGRGLGPG